MDKQMSVHKHQRSAHMKCKGFNTGQMVRIAMLTLSFVLMLIALLLFGILIGKDIVKMTIRINPDGFTALVEKLEKIVDETSGVVVNGAEQELRRTKDELKTVKMQLHETQEELNKVKGQMTNPGNPLPKPIKWRRGLSATHTSTTFDVALRPLTIVKFDRLDDIPVIGMMITVFANIVINLLTFPLLLLLMITIVACFLYLCKIFGRLFYYLVNLDTYAPAKGGSRLLRYVSIINFLLSYVQEILWAVAVTLILFVLCLVYVGGWTLLKRGGWRNCWLGLFTIDFTFGEAILLVQIATVCGFIGILLNLLDQIIDISCPTTRRSHTAMKSNQNKAERARWITETTT